MARVLSDETTLSRQQKQLARESRILRRLVVGEAGLAALLALGGLVFFLLRGQSGLLWLAGVLAFLAVGHHLKTRHNAQQANTLGAGLKGEVEVAHLLADGLDRDYYLYNDLNVRSGFRRAQIDHVIIGPCGVVVIETKNWRGRLVGDENEKAWQQYRFEDVPPRRVGNPILQNRRHAEVLTACLRSKGLPEAPVIPLVVFTARRAVMDIKNLQSTLLWPNELCDHIRRLPAATAFDTAAQDAVLNRFQRFAA
jgi:hypothetical protein